jgi:hypothetical protein
MTSEYDLSNPHTDSKRFEFHIQIRNFSKCIPKGREPGQCSSLPVQVVHHRGEVIPLPRAGHRPPGHGSTYRFETCQSTGMLFSKTFLPASPKSAAEENSNDCMSWLSEAKPTHVFRMLAPRSEALSFCEGVADAHAWLRKL